MIETIRRWHNNAPAPIIWLAAMLFIYVWLVAIAIVGAMLDGGFSEVVSEVPDYASNTGAKFLTLYLVLLALYFLFRLAVHMLRRIGRL